MFIYVFKVYWLFRSLNKKVWKVVSFKQLLEKKVNINVAKSINYVKPYALIKRWREAINLSWAVKFCHVLKGLPSHTFNAKSRHWMRLEALKHAQMQEEAIVEEDLTTIIKEVKWLFCSQTVYKISFWRKVDESLATRINLSFQAIIDFYSFEEKNCLCSKAT